MVFVASARSRSAVRHARQAKLPTLHVSKLGLKALPASIGRAASLRKLTLVLNRLMVLLRSLFELTDLEKFGFDRVQVTPMFPDSLEAVRPSLKLPSRPPALPRIGEVRSDARARGATEDSPC